MSIVKRFEVRCDHCQERMEWDFELVANSEGITKGGGTEECRQQAIDEGWTRHKLNGRVRIDLCPRCSELPPPKKVWFQKSVEART